MTPKDRENTLKNLSAFSGKTVFFSENGKTFLGNFDGKELRKLFNIYEVEDADIEFFENNGVEYFLNMPDVKLDPNAVAEIDRQMAINQYSTVGADWAEPNYGKPATNELDHDPHMVSDVNEVARFIVTEMLWDKGNKAKILDPKSGIEFTCSMDYLQNMKNAGSVINRTTTAYRYVEPMYDGRAYHNITHVENMLHISNLMQPYFTEAEFETLTLAILFHDCVYDTVVPTLNELRSAEEYMNYVKMFSGIIEYDQLVVNAIMATKYHFNPTFVPQTKVEKFIMDIDLMAFAYDYAEFVEVNNNLTSEFINLGAYPRDFVLGKRKEFLQSIIDDKSLQFRCSFFKIYEASAYQNITRYLENYERHNGE